MSYVSNGGYLAQVSVDVGLRACRPPRRASLEPGCPHLNAVRAVSDSQTDIGNIPFRMRWGYARGGQNSARDAYLRS